MIKVLLHKTAFSVPDSELLKAYFSDQEVKIMEKFHLQTSFINTCLK